METHKKIGSYTNVKNKKSYSHCFFSFFLKCLYVDVGNMSSNAISFDVNVSKKKKK